MAWIFDWRRCAFWRQSQYGYTQRRDEAGQWPREMAEDILGSFAEDDEIIDEEFVGRETLWIPGNPWPRIFEAIENEGMRYPQEDDPKGWPIKFNRETWRWEE